MHLVIANADTNSEDEMEQLRASIDFLVELCETDSPVRSVAHFIICLSKNKETVNYRLIFWCVNCNHMLSF